MSARHSDVGRVDEPRSRASILGVPLVLPALQGLLQVVEAERGQRHSNGQNRDENRAHRVPLFLVVTPLLCSTRTYDGGTTGARVVRYPFTARPYVAGYREPMPGRIATAEKAELPELLDFVRRRHRMVLTTFRRDGSPQSSPVTGGVDAAGRLVIASYPRRAKSVNILRRPTVSVVVLSDDFSGPYVQVDGDAEVIDLPDAVEPLVDYYRAVAGEHPDWNDYRRAMIDQGKCLIRITPHRWGPVATGGFPPP